MFSILSYAFCTKVVQLKDFNNRLHNIFGSLFRYSFYPFQNGMFIFVEMLWELFTTNIQLQIKNPPLIKLSRFVIQYLLLIKIFIKEKQKSIKYPSKKIPLIRKSKCVHFIFFLK